MLTKAELRAAPRRAAGRLAQAGIRRTPQEISAEFSSTSRDDCDVFTDHGIPEPWLRER